MARGITVYREVGGDPLYDEPLGSEAMVRQWWSEPATSLGLPLLASIYDQGFYHGIRWSGVELAQVQAELARLQLHWDSMSLPADVAAGLAERAGYLREAVEMAMDCGGFVSIA
ncbi:MAG: hypothetical protein U0790_18055 [Isosphaeraceae bacterium]